MNLFESVKAAVTVRQAAEHYGLEVGRSGMTRCPFHDDRHPSLKLNESYFDRFGCGATGDVIDFVARLFGLSSYEAAQKLAYDFGIDPDKPPTAAALEKPKYPLARAFRQEELHCQRVLCDYLHLLERWKVQYAPNSPDEVLDDRFVEACQMLDRIEYLADILAFAELEVRVKTVDMLCKDGTIERLEERLNRLGKEGDAHEEPEMLLTALFGLTVRISMKLFFCDEFLSHHKIIFANGAFFTPDGRVTDDIPLRGTIYERIEVLRREQHPPEDHQHPGGDEAGRSCGGLSTGSRSNPSDERHLETGRNFYRGPAGDCAEPAAGSIPAGCTEDLQCWLSFLDGLLYPGGHPHLAGVYRLLSDSQQQRTADDGH